MPAFACLPWMFKLYFPVGFFFPLVMCLSCITDTGLLPCSQLIPEIVYFISVTVSQLDGSDKQNLLVLLVGNYLFKLFVGIRD